MGFRKGTDMSISGNNPWCRAVGHLKFSLLVLERSPQVTGRDVGVPSECLRFSLLSDTYISSEVSDV